MMKRAAIYVRVSTTGQTIENQERDLRAVAAKAGWKITKVYADIGISGARRRNDRPAFKAMCDDASRRRFDMVMSWSVDRLGRSLQDLVGFLSDLSALRIDLYLHVQAIDTSSPAGRALFQMLGVFSEFERSLIRERVISGLQRAKAQGTALGRPRVGQTVEDEIKVMLKTGTRGIRAIARDLGVGTGTVQRVKAEMR
jgi:DNA invertase Pin-like site-specific DNA recombinase